MVALRYRKLRNPLVGQLVAIVLNLYLFRFHTAKVVIRTETTKEKANFLLLSNGLAEESGCFSRGKTSAKQALANLVTIVANLRDLSRAPS